MKLLSKMLSIGFFVTSMFIQNANALPWPSANLNFTNQNVSFGYVNIRDIFIGRSSFNGPTMGLDIINIGGEVSISSGYSVSLGIQTYDLPQGSPGMNFLAVQSAFAPGCIELLAAAKAQYETIKALNPAYVSQSYFSIQVDSATGQLSQGQLHIKSIVGTKIKCHSVF